MIARSRLFGVIAALALWGGSAHAATLTAADITDPASQFFNTANGHIYEFVLDGGTWTNALSLAAGKALAGSQGYLATITSSSEQNFVYGRSLVFMPQALSPSAYWLGGTDSVAEGVWKWVSGPEAGAQFWQGDANGSAVGGAYQHWDFTSDPPQPNTDINAATEDYLELMTNMSWNNLHMGFWGDDTLAGNGNGYVVEYGSAVPEPSAWGLMIVGFIAAGVRLRQRPQPSTRKVGARRWA